MEEKEDILLFGPQLLALMELCHIRAQACFASRVKVCDCHLVKKVDAQPLNVSFGFAAGDPQAGPRGVVGRSREIPCSPSPSSGTQDCVEGVPQWREASASRSGSSGGRVEPINNEDEPAEAEKARWPGA